MAVSASRILSNAFRFGARTMRDLVVPPLCVACGKQRWGEQPLCLCCIRRLRPVGEESCSICGLPGCDTSHDETGGPISCIIGAFLKEEVLTSLIHGLKYRGQYPNARFLVAWALRRSRLATGPQGVDALVPVPLHPSRKRERGYNQAELLARQLSGAWRVPLLPGALRKCRQTGNQARLGRAARADNLEQVFELDPRQNVAGKHLGLVDDVLTTGATTRACAKVLLDGGAASVRCCVMGLVPRQDSVADLEEEWELAAGFLL